MNGSGSGMWSPTLCSSSCLFIHPDELAVYDFCRPQCLSQMNLYEGNVSPSIIVDDDWGTGPAGMTVFRNYLNGPYLGTQRAGVIRVPSLQPWDIAVYSGKYIGYALSGCRYGVRPQTRVIGSSWYRLPGLPKNTNR